MRLEQRRFSERSFLMGAVTHAVDLLFGWQEAGWLHQEDVGRSERWSQNFLPDWQRVVLDFSRLCISRTGDLALSLPYPISLFVPSFPSHKPKDGAKSLWLRTLQFHSLGFGFCNSIRMTNLKADALHSPLYLSLLASPLPANRCRFLHIKAVDLPG